MRFYKNGRSSHVNYGSTFSFPTTKHCGNFSQNQLATYVRTLTRNTSKPYADGTHAFRGLLFQIPLLWVRAYNKYTPNFLVSQLP